MHLITFYKGQKELMEVSRTVTTLHFLLSVVIFKSIPWLDSNSRVHTIVLTHSGLLSFQGGKRACCFFSFQLVSMAAVATRFCSTNLLSTPIIFGVSVSRCSCTPIFLSPSALLSRSAKNEQHVTVETKRRMACYNQLPQASNTRSAMRR